MQPYFIPYAGYFRLFCASDVVVLFDCVQFPRRGWVHRNVLPLASGSPDWLTLPIEKSDRSILINQLKFADHARERLADSMRRFPLLETARKQNSPVLNRVMDLGETTVADYLAGLVEYFSSILGFVPRILRSSSLNIPDDLHAQERVMAIAERCGASTYLNPPGGRNLYNGNAFAKKGIDLRFLPDYEASSASILARVLLEAPEVVASEIVLQTSFEP
jgi:hypothetical protein